MDKFNDNLGSDMSELMEASGVNDVLPDGDYETQISADGEGDGYEYAIFKKKKKEKLTPEQEAEKKKKKSEKFDNIVSKAGKVADTVSKGASIAKGAADAYNKSKAPKEEESYDEGTDANPNKKYFLIGGIVAAVAILALIVAKVVKKQPNK